MTTTALLVLSLIAFSPATGPSAEDLAAYESLKVQAGRDPAEQVKLALWCESHGLNTERFKHLALAVLADPTNATARGLMGVVAYHGQWKRPEVVAEKVKADEALTAKLAEYNARRAKAPETADGQWALGLWCEQNDLPAEALAPFTTVTQLDPSREAAWKRLGCKKVNGRWVSDAQLAAEKEEVDLRKKADKRWKPLLTKWRGMLGEKSKHDDAEKALSEVVDPRAVPSVWSVFIAGMAANHSVGVQLLGQIDTASSSRALAYLSVFDDSAEVRRAATETLKRRDPREFAGLLVAMLQKPIKYEVRPVGGPGSPGAIFVEGKLVNLQRNYAAPAMPYIPIWPSEWTKLDANGLPVYVVDSYYTADSTNHVRVSLQDLNAFHPGDPQLAQAVNAVRPHLGHDVRNWLMRSNPKNRMVFMGSAAGRELEMATFLFVGASRPVQTPMKAEYQLPVGQIAAEYQMAAASAQDQLNRDVAAIDGINESTQQQNHRVAQILSDVSGLSLGDDQTAWTKWWVDLQGYAYTPPEESPKPTVVETVAPAYMPQPVRGMTIRSPAGPSVAGSWSARFTTASPFPSCFGAGTLVRTLDGSRPIESIQVGDRVLTQDVKTGALGYHPVTVLHHNPPSPTFLVKLGSDTIVSSPFHRFWIVGKGWIMARDLKGGETLRLLTGPARVESVESGPVQLVFNLDVADAHDFFAGAAAALVHDNTLPETRLTPFDATTEMSPGVALK